MELQELKQQLVNKQVSPLYVFTGCEVGIMNIYIHKIAQTVGAVTKRVDSVSSIYNKVQNKGFINATTVYIVSNDKQYTTQENAWQNLNNGVIQGNNVIVLVYSNIDKRSKFYKAHQDIIVEFEKLSAEVLAKYITKEIELPASYGVELAEMCDKDYSRILLECDKLRHYSNAIGQDIVTTYRQAIENKLIYSAPKDVIFNFIDAVCRRQTVKAYDLYQELLAIGENQLAMISLLYNNIRAMLLVSQAGDGDVTARTGLTAWQVKMAREKGNRYTTSELVRALRTIRETERNIKIGEIEQNIAVDYILVSIL